MVSRVALRPSMLGSAGRAGACPSLRTGPAPHPAPRPRPALRSAGGQLPARGRVLHTQPAAGERARRHYQTRSCFLEVSYGNTRAFCCFSAKQRRERAAVADSHRHNTASRLATRCLWRNSASATEPCSVISQDWAARAAFVCWERWSPEPGTGRRRLQHWWRRYPPPLPNPLRIRSVCRSSADGTGTGPVPKKGYTGRRGKHPNVLAVGFQSFGQGTAGSRQAGTAGLWRSPPRDPPGESWNR